MLIWEVFYEPNFENSFCITAVAVHHYLCRELLQMDPREHLHQYLQLNQKDN
jgi:hypothetical protein